MSEKHGILVRFQGLPLFYHRNSSFLVFYPVPLVHKKRASVKLAQELAICREQLARDCGRDKALPQPGFFSHYLR